MKLSTVVKLAAVAAIGYVVYNVLTGEPEAVETLALPAPDEAAPATDDTQSA